MPTLQPIPPTMKNIGIATSLPPGLAPLHAKAAWIALLSLILFFGAPISSALAAPVQICAGVTVDNDAISDASAGINACLNNLTGGGSLLLPPGRYLIASEVIIPHSGITLGTAGLIASAQRCGVVVCATLLGEMTTTRAEFTVRTLPNVTATRLNHLVVDGRRWEWRANSFSTLHSYCTTQFKGGGVQMQNATNSVVDYTVVTSTPCHTGLAIASTPSSNLIIRYSDFSGNGENLGINGMWADGITIGFISNSFIEYNGFYNNSDVSLILGGGSNTIIRGNVFLQTTQRIFAAFMLTNWTWNRSPMQWADFRGLSFENNSMSCQAFCDIGVQIGVLPWAGSNNVGMLRTMGATIANNSISGQKQLINIAGGGTDVYPVVLSWNSLVNDGGAWLNAGLSRSIPTYYINIQGIWADSFVDVSNNWTNAITAQNWNNAF